MRKDILADGVRLMRELYPGRETIALHEPVLGDPDRRVVEACIDSGYVSSVGAYVGQLEKLVAGFTGVPWAVATVNGTAALHVALLLAGVRAGDEVITQPLSFVATCNAIAYCGARPVLVDVDRRRLSLCPQRLERFLREHCDRGPDGACRNRRTGAVIRACVPMHTFGHPADVDALVAVCDRHGIALVEDAAESLGSLSAGRHTGGFGRLGILSFNGNKIVTTGGGGMILTHDKTLADEAKRLTTTAKVDHPWEYEHDRVGFNYRMPNLNAALGCAQMGRLDQFIARKRETARAYRGFFGERGIETIEEAASCRSNYWLCAVVLPSAADRDEFLRYTNEHGIRTRPLWKLAPDLPMYRDVQHDGMETSRWLYERVVNLPSGVQS